jgi:RNA polymerase sigma-70 factor (ECF subfamily)
MQSDRVIISGLIKRDPKVIDDFLETYADYIYSIVFNVCRSKQDTEEATQDVVMKIINKAHTFDYSCKLKTWMYSIAKRTAIDYRRRVKYTVDINTTFDMKSEDDTSHLAKHSDEQKLIESLLSSLPINDRELLEMFYLKELSIKEIEEITDLSASNIKVKLYRIRKNLVEKMPKLSNYEF